VALVRELYRVPSYRPAQPWFTAAAVLARVWRWGTRIKMRRDYARRRKLAAPVISIGTSPWAAPEKRPARCGWRRSSNSAGASRGY